MTEPQLRAIAFAAISQTEDVSALRARVMIDTMIRLATEQSLLTVNLSQADLTRLMESVSSIDSRLTSFVTLSA